MRRDIKTFILLLAGMISLSSIVSEAGDIYRWTDEKGTIVYSDSPPPHGSFKKERIEDQIDQTIERKKEVDANSELIDQEKHDQKIKIELDYEKRAREIRNYNAMREELKALEEKYQKKMDELKRQWNRNFPGSSSRHDITEESQKLQREYREEVKKVKEYYGYH